MYRLLCRLLARFIVAVRSEVRAIDRTASDERLAATHGSQFNRANLDALGDKARTANAGPGGGR